MKVAVDIQPVLTSLTGVGYHVYNLLESMAFLLREGSQETTLRSGDIAGVFFSVRNRNTDTFRFMPDIGVKPVGWIPGRFLFKAWRYAGWPPYGLLVRGASVFHFPNFVLPPIHKPNTIITVHDLTFVKFPDCVEKKNRAYLEALVPGSIERAARVLTVSQAIKEEIIEVFSVPEDKVTVIHNGVSWAFRPVEDRDFIIRTRNMLKLPERFILTVSTVEPRKNIENLLRAYDIMVEEYGTDMDLVVVGMLGWDYEKIFSILKKQKSKGRVHFLGYVAEECMPVVYSMADCFVSSSLYEGFGMPILEAAACGTPVFCSDIPVYKELFGGFCEMFDPLDPHDIAHTITERMEDSGKKLQLTRSAMKKAHEYTWIESARKTMAVYEELLAK